MYSNKKIASVLLNASVNGSACRAAKIISGLLFACIMSINVSLWSSAPNADNAFDKRNLDLLSVGEYDLPGCESVQDCSDDDLFGGPVGETLEELQDDLGDFLTVVSGICKDYDAADARGEVSKEVGAVSGKRKRADVGGVAGQPVAKRVGDDSKKKYSCTWKGCNYAAAQSGNLETHMRTHTGKKPFVCDFPGCNYAAAQSGNLETHMRTHTGKTPFGCDFEGCFYRAKSKSDLNKHKASHNPDRQKLVCGIDGCVHAVTQMAHLKAHMRTHTGEKPFVCGHEGCGYRARQASNLKIHQGTHTGEKPYVCGIGGCVYASITSGDLKIHKRTHFVAKPYVCHIYNCKFRAAELDILEEHTKEHLCDFPGCCYTVASIGDLEIHRKKIHSVGAGLSVGERAANWLTVLISHQASRHFNLPLT